MAIENETSERVNNEELLEDIKFTERRLNAFQKISEGFTMLINLPDATSSRGYSKLVSQKLFYSDLEQKCARMLKNLHSLKSERGL